LNHFNDKSDDVRFAVVCAALRRVPPLEYPSIFEAFRLRS